VEKVFTDQLFVNEQTATKRTKKETEESGVEGERRRREGGIVGKEKKRREKEKERGYLLYLVGRGRERERLSGRVR
jgi:hypothetical protein